MFLKITVNIYINFILFLIASEVSLDDMFLFSFHLQILSGK